MASIVSLPPEEIEKAANNIRENIERLRLYVESKAALKDGDVSAADETYSRSPPRSVLLALGALTGMMVIAVGHVWILRRRTE